ncbi:unnamed protein product [Echinostoma caproni]|uniref:EF-hand domain-containing protein n=1 Tax=Echinostoma caproni TaxID=27848 RepID=A0A183A8M5_9TREM|nr:unnamed protein product [Echinostoma caproni]
MTTRRLSMVPRESLFTEGPEGRRLETMNSDNCLLNFFDPEKMRFRNLSACQFADVWNHFDRDGNGFIDGDEVETFLNRLVDCIVTEEVRQTMSPVERNQLVGDLMKEIDTNKDNKIDIREVTIE